MLTLSLSIHLVNSPPHINFDELPSLVEGINNVWETVEIRFKLVQYSHRYIKDWPDISVLESRCTKSPDGTIHGYYGCWLSANTDKNRRFWPTSRKRVYCVPDHPLMLIDPTPSLINVSSHQIGHILGLRHYPEPQGYLMTSNDDGSAFQDHEKITAVKKAKRLIQVSSDNATMRGARQG